MDFISAHHSIIEELGDSITANQLEHLEQMKKAFDFYKNQYCLSNELIDALERQQATLQQQIHELELGLNKKSAEKFEVLREIAILNQTRDDLNTHIKHLKAREREIQDNMSELESSSKGKAISKGIFVKKYNDLISFVSDIHEYTYTNRCATKNSLESHLRSKCIKYIKICKICKRSGKYCSCD